LANRLIRITIFTNVGEKKISTPVFICQKTLTIILVDILMFLRIVLHRANKMPFFQICSFHLPFWHFSERNRNTSVQNDNYL